jgi:hypothetical protein
MKVSFTILSEPASKANSRKLVTFGKRPGFIKSEKARQYEATARDQIPENCRVMFTGDVRFTADIYYASRRPDLDESVILDVLQAEYKKIGGRRLCTRHGVYLNDRQVKEKIVRWHLDTERPRAVITVEELAEQSPLLDTNSIQHSLV